MKLSYHTYQLRFKHPFTISRGTKTHQPTLVVQLEHLGYTGYGEAPAIPYYGVTLEKMEAVLKAKGMMASKFAFTEPERYWHFLHHLLPNDPFIVCALDMAGWDIYAQMKKKQLFECWAKSTAHNPDTDYTIGIDSTEKMVGKMKELPWPVYKVKVGTDRDLEMIATLRKHTDSVIRVDANAGWTPQMALNILPQLHELGVEMVEQPLPAAMHEEMKEIYDFSPIPLFADESCVTESDVDKCAGFFHGINIKLTKCSGITPALRMIKRARQLGLKVMLGCMNESTIGTAAVAHLLPLVDMADMDGPLLLEEDLATGIGYRQGKLVYSGETGLGISFKGLFERKDYPLV